MKAEWRNAQGRIVLFVGNKHTGPLTNVKSSVLPPPHLRMQSAVVPENIPPRAQVCSRRYSVCSTSLENAVHHVQALKTAVCEDIKVTDQLLSFYRLVFPLLSSSVRLSRTGFRIFHLLLL